MIHSLIIQIAPITERNPAGICKIGHYIVEKDCFVMVDPEDSSKRLSKPIKLNGRPHEDAARAHLRNEVLKDRGSDFNRPLVYRDAGWR